MNKLLSEEQLREMREKQQVLNTPLNTQQYFKAIESIADDVPTQTASTEVKMVADWLSEKMSEYLRSKGYDVTTYFPDVLKAAVKIAISPLVSERDGLKLHLEEGGKIMQEFINLNTRLGDSLDHVQGCRKCNVEGWESCDYGREALKALKEFHQ